VRYLGPTGTRIDAAIRDLESRSVRARVLAAEALGRCPADDQARASAALRPRLYDSSPDVRYAVALALGELGDHNAVGPLVQLLDDPEPMPSQAAAVALGSIGDASAAEPLARALRGGRPELRLQAAIALPLVDPAGTLEPLQRALDDEDAEVRAAAAAALGDLKQEPSRERLAKLSATDPELTVRLEAAAALARLGDRRGTAVLVPLLDDRDYGLLAAEHLFRCPDPSAAEALRKVSTRWLAPPLLKVWALGALARLGEEAARRALVDLLQSKAETVRGLTIQVLGEIDQPWSRNTLKSLLAPPVDPRWEGLRDEILEALGDPLQTA